MSDTTDTYRNTREFVFISYSHADSPLADAIKSVFGRLGVSVWLDTESLSGGQRWKDSIKAGINGSSLFIACLSDSYFKNPQSFIRDELSIAFDELDKRPRDTWFIPVKLADYDAKAIPSDIARRLQDLHIIDFTGGFETGLTELLTIALSRTRPDVYWSSVLRQILSGHIAAKVKHFSDSQTLRINQIESLWNALTEDAVIKPLSSLFVATLEKAELTGTHQIEQLYAEDKTILVSCIPYFDSDAFKRSLATTGTDVANRYLQFVLEYARAARRVEGWRRRDLVHVLYFKQESEWILDVLYLISTDLFFTIVGYLLERGGRNAGSSGLTPINFEEMYPTYLANAVEFTQFINTLRQEETASLNT